VVIGGSLVLAILTRLLLPPFMVVAHRWRDRYLARRGPSKSSDDDDEDDAGDLEKVDVHPHEGA